VTDYADPQWRFAARVKRLMDKHGSTKQEAERIVKYVIETKEEVIHEHSTKSENRRHDLSA
jgi:hypothetical protein